MLCIVRCEENRKNYEAVSKRSFKLNIDPLYGLHAYSLVSILCYRFLLHIIACF